MKIKHVFIVLLVVSLLCSMACVSAFDDENNILVSSENLETLVPREWLHYLNKYGFS